MSGFLKERQKRNWQFSSIKERKNLPDLYHCYSDKGLKGTDIKSKCNFVNGARQDQFKFHQQSH